MSSKKRKKDRMSLPPLLPCPFCGDPADLRKFNDQTSVIQCANKKCKISPYSWEKSQHKAIKAWNRRAS